MKRLLISALLAALVHAYWLFGNVAESDGSSQGEIPRSVVISLVTGVQSPAPGPGTEPGVDLESITQTRGSVPAAARPVIKERKDGSSHGDGPVEEDSAPAFGDSFEPGAKDDAITADAPIIEQDDGSVVARGTPKTKAKTTQARQDPRAGRARNAGQRGQPVKSRSQSVKPITQIAKLAEVEQQEGRAEPAQPQGGRTEARDGPRDDRGKTQPNRGATANRDASITQALKGVLKEARPIYKRNPRPPYPRVARRRGYEGTVIVRALVGMDGLVNEVRLDESSGHETLDGAALQTVQRWAFEPALRGTETVEMWVRIPLRFSLD